MVRMDEMAWLHLWQRLHNEATAKRLDEYRAVLRPSMMYASIALDYRDALSEAIMQEQDEKLAALFPPAPKVSWWASTFGCAWWHLTHYGFRSWLIWELERRPRGDLISPNMGSPFHASCSRTRSRPPMADKFYTLPNG